MLDEFNASVGVLFSFGCVLHCRASLSMSACNMAHTLLYVSQLLSLSLLFHTVHACPLQWDCCFFTSLSCSVHQEHGNKLDECTVTFHNYLGVWPGCINCHSWNRHHVTLWLAIALCFFVFSAGVSLARLGGSSKQWVSACMKMGIYTCFWNHRRGKQS